MTLSYLFWTLMLIWLVFGLWWHSRDLSQYGPMGSNLFLFVLLLLLGWESFGAPIKG